MLNAWQFFDEAPIGSNDQCVVNYLRTSGQYDPATLAQISCFGSNKSHTLTAQKIVRRDDEVFASAQPTGNPDDPR